MEALEQLTWLIDELLTLFKEYRETFWSARFDRARGFLRNQDFRGIDLILGAYGGMGSFNEFSLESTSDSELQQEEVAMANRRLLELSKQIYDVADHLRREELIRSLKADPE